MGNCKWLQIPVQASYDALLLYEKALIYIFLKQRHDSKIFSATNQTHIQPRD